MTSSSMLAAAALVALAMPSVAAAACDPYEVTVTQVSGLTYSPTDPLDTRIALELRATATGLDADCVNLPVILGPSAEDPRPLRLSNGQHDLQGRFPGSGNATQALNRLVLTRPARALLVANQPVRIDLSDVTRSQFVRAGDYTSELQLRVGDQREVFSVGSTVLPTIVLLGASADGQEQISLGDITQGGRGSARLFYRSNADLRVGAVSDNGGFLVHAEGSAFGRVPYDAAYSGTPMNLTSGPFSRELSFSGTGIKSDILTIEVPVTPDLFAGLYSDVITLSFQPY